MLIVALILYTLIALIFLGESYLEGERDCQGWDVWRVAGLLLGLIWPVQILIVLLAVVSRDGTGLQIKSAAGD